MICSTRMPLFIQQRSSIAVLSNLQGIHKSKFYSFLVAILVHLKPWIVASPTHFHMNGVYLIRSQKNVGDFCNAAQLRYFKIGLDENVIFSRVLLLIFIQGKYLSWLQMQTYGYINTIFIVPVVLKNFKF